jgi:hypothetical protein
MAWFWMFLIAYSGASLLVSPWHMYLPSIAYALLAALTLKCGVEGFRKGLASKASAIAGAAIILSVTAYSPLLVDYPAPRAAASLIQLLNGQTLSAAKYLPQGSTIYLMNYPEYMMLTGKGSPYSVFMVSEGSVQALLDYVLQEKGMRAYSLTSIIAYSERGPIKVGMSPQANCVIAAENIARDSANLYPSTQWLPASDGREGITYKATENGNGQWVTIAFPQRNWAGAYLFVFDGQAVNVRELAKICA